MKKKKKMEKKICYNFVITLCLSFDIHILWLLNIYKVKTFKKNHTIKKKKSAKKYTQNESTKLQKKRKKKKKMVVVYTMVKTHYMKKRNSVHTTKNILYNFT